MNARVLAIIMLYLAGIGLGIAGIVNLSEAGEYHMEQDHAYRLMTNGYVCLSIGSKWTCGFTLAAFHQQVCGRGRK